eukprot:TRINITY_DN15155_c0_g1_i1.p1 TRINITY_DN15155_c0_g1~~TRINITY_DN15155_c0_g1_i1.p1  ORF type:complete len:514 (+),score=152.72 TRINITY_DN15155_c0_g1_i1:93-1544(+)
MALAAVAFSKDPKHPSVLSDEIITTGEDSFPVPMAFRLPLSAKGRGQTSLRMPLTAKVSDLKRALHAQEAFDRPVEDLEFYILGEELADNRTMLSYERQGVKGIIQVRGGFKEVLLTTAVVPVTFPVNWHVHATVTDLARAVYRRLKGFVGAQSVHLDWVRIRHRPRGAPPDSELQEIPLRAAYRYRDPALRWDATLSELELATPSEPCTVKFRRTVDGEAVHQTLNLTGASTVRQVHDEVVAAHRRKEAEQEDDGWVSSVLKPQNDRQADAYKARQKATFAKAWDDDDASVAPSGEKRVYMYTPATPGYIRTDDLEEGAVYMSYHPPPVQPPEFVTIEENHEVRHLSDLGILPDTELEISFWSETWKIWSSEVTKLQLSEPPCADVTFRMWGGQRLRVPVAPHETFEEVLLKLWCASGAQPQDAMLRAEDGRKLDEFHCPAYYSLLPETDIHVTRRPRPWDTPEEKARAMQPPRINPDLAVP